jgi:hypothetical protein
MQLRQLHDILVALGVKSEIHVVAAGTSDDDVRAALVGNLGRSSDYAVVNYFGPVLGQEGGGHISPLGAYDEPPTPSWARRQPEPRQGVGVGPGSPPHRCHAHARYHREPGLPAGRRMSA